MLIQVDLERRYEKNSQSQLWIMLMPAVSELYQLYHISKDTKRSFIVGFLKRSRCQL